MDQQAERLHLSSETLGVAQNRIARLRQAESALRGIKVDIHGVVPEATAVHTAESYSNVVPINSSLQTDTQPELGVLRNDSVQAAQDAVAAAHAYGDAA